MIILALIFGVPPFQVFPGFDVRPGELPKRIVPALSYHDGYAESVRTQTPLVTGIGCIAPSGAWVNSTAATLPGYKAPCIVISLPRGDTLYYHATLDANATAEQIRRALPQGRIPPQNGVPFRVSAPMRSANC